MARLEPSQRRNARRAALIAGLFAGLAALFTINGPGITVDEPLDVAPGRQYVQTLAKRGLDFFRPDVVVAVFADNAEHPPLGRWLLGIASTLGEPIELILLGKDPIGLYIRAARAAPAICFGLLVALAAWEAGRRAGPVAAGAAGFALAAMPRVFGHAHIAALDLFVALTWTAGLLTALRAAERSKPVRALGLAGILFGLALLTKIHGWLLIPAVAAYLAIRLPIRKAILGLLVWTTVGLLVFFLGWPWLWYDPAGRLLAYLRTGVDRTSILVGYFGTDYRDVQVPWHYPWLYFLATVPIGLHLLAMAGVWSAVRRWRSDPAPMFLGVVVLGWLTLFSTNVAVYDGERLYLAAFPLWAILAGLGFANLWDRLRSIRLGRPILVLALPCQLYGIVAFHPCELSYHNALIGGLPGAERLGLELTYWTDAVTPELLELLAREADQGATAALVPTLAPGQGAAATTRALALRSIVLMDQEAFEGSEWIVVHRRESYLGNPALKRLIATSPVVLVERQGVWLAGLWRRPIRENRELD